LNPLLTRQWVFETVKAIWGFDLQWWQTEDIYKLLTGGIYSVMYPTDYGKSTMIEIVVVLGLILDHNRRYIVVKINDAAAQETSYEICSKLQRAADVFKLAEVRPLVAWRNGNPFGISNGFWVGGADRAVGLGRNSNRSVHVYALGSRDLQGKRGATLVDDVETQEEANSLAMRQQLEKRLSAVMRTLEDRPDALWGILGTPYHETSVYFDFVVKLRGLGVRYEEIRREPRLPDGSLLWPQRAQKMEIHRRTMTKTEFAAAYELRPVSARRFRPEDIEALKEPTWDFPRDERAFRLWLYEHLISIKPEFRAEDSWAKECLAKLTTLEFYIGWDPATTGDHAISAVALLGWQTYLLRAMLGVGDVWDQALKAKSLFELFPSASVIIEKNAQQKAFKDVFEKACPDAPVFGYGTYAAAYRESYAASMPAFMAEVREGKLHIPWGDREVSEREFSDFTTELEQYGPTAHPHIIPSIWFCWAWSHQHEIEKPTKKALGEAGEQEITHHKILLPSSGRGSLRSSEMIAKSREAWKRKRLTG
jgi:hypothetical protein